MATYSEALARCTTTAIPWSIIRAGQKWCRLLSVSRVIVGTLREMNPVYPAPQHDLSGVIVE